MKKIILKEFRKDLERYSWKVAVQSQWSRLIYPFKRRYRFIIKLYKYGQLLWDDFEFDYIYLLEVIRLKLILMSDHFDDRGMMMLSPRKAKEMRLCVALIDRIIADDYCSLQHKKLDEKYGKTIWDSEPTDNPSFQKIIMHREFAKQGSNEYQKEYEESNRIFKHEEYMKKQDIAYLFHIMNKKLQCWWG